MTPDREWFDRPVLEVAADLLGAVVQVDRPDGLVAVRITEVEAYAGAVDPGSHAFRGRTTRNAVMFGEPARLYVYRHLGLHHCANVVTGRAGEASAVLLRAGEVIEGARTARARRRAAGVVRSDTDLARGPARLAVALGLTRDDDGLDLLGPGAALCVGPRPGVYLTGPRVGVSGPGRDGAAFPGRLGLPAEPTVSDYRPGVRRRARPSTR